MKDYLNLWVEFFQGLLALLVAIFLPFIWLALEILPWGITCLFFGNRLKKGYRYLYFVPRFIKELTSPLRKPKPLRNQETEIVSFFIFLYTEFRLEFQSIQLQSDTVG